MSEMHPFNDAFAVIKTMKAEIGELRAALQAEQQDREKRDAIFQREIIVLRESMNKDRAYNKEAYDRLGSAITSETALRGKVNQKDEGRFQEVNRLIANLDKLQQSHVTSIAKQKVVLDTEVQERKSFQVALQQQMDTCATTCTTSCAKLQDDMTTNFAQVLENMARDKDLVNQILASVQYAGRTMTSLATKVYTTEFSEVSTMANSPDLRNASPLSLTATSGMTGVSMSG